MIFRSMNHIIKGRHILNTVKVRNYKVIEKRNPVQWQQLKSLSNVYSYNPIGKAPVAPSPIVFITNSKDSMTNIVEQMNYPYGVIVLETEENEDLSSITQRFRDVLKNTYKERAFIVGHNIGGIAGYKAAVENLDTVSGIVIIESNIEEAVEKKELPDLESLKIYQQPLAIVKCEKDSNLSENIVSHFHTHHFVRQYATVENNDFTEEKTAEKIATIIDNFVKEYDIHQEILGEFEFYKEKAANI